MELWEVSGLAAAFSHVVRDHAAKLKSEIWQEFDRRIKEIPAGPRGEPGEKGQPGESVKGEKGDPGEPGQSIVGPVGPQGEKGEPGERGESIRGEKGDKGDTGETGAQGPPGLQGVAGPQGERGEKGEPGISIKGDPGERGGKGADGINGKDAPVVDTEKLVTEILGKIVVPKDGVNGKDADPEFVRELVISEVGKAITALPKPKDGLPGKDAEPIHVDTVRLMVLDEVQKAVSAIPPAKDGKDGLPGRDALEPYILPAINPSKSYPMGTTGAHAGGTIRALKQTTPGESLDMSEWIVLLNGTASDVMDWGDDAGTMVFERTYTDGSILRKELHYPAMKHAGVFRDGEYYRKGHTVTSGNSTWLCNVTGTKAKPGLPPHDDWTMIARAIKGKDGERGLPGKDGVPGKPGRDLTQMDSNGHKY